MAVVFVILRLEKKAGRKVGALKSNINIRFVENIVRFIVILVAFQWVIFSSPLTKSIGTVVFRGSALLVAIGGFAAQPVIADLICGLMISFTKPFDIGDRIELEDGTAGIVKDITVRHVVIQKIDTIQMIVPNSKLNGMKLLNMSYHTETRSIYFQFNVSYDTDVKNAMAVIFGAIKESPYSIPGKKRKDSDEYEYGPVYFLAYTDSSLQLAVTVYFEPVHPSEVVKSDINTRVNYALKDAGIEIPYNYVTVVMNQPEKTPAEDKEISA